MELTDHQIGLIHASFSSTYLGSSSSNRLTDIIKLSGAKVADDKSHIDLFTSQQYTKAFFKNVHENPRVSFLLTSIYTLEAYQLKGIYIGHRLCTAEEIKYQMAYVEGFARHRVNIGMKNGFAFTTYYRDPSIAIRVKAEEIYEQTPKTGTGKRIS